MKDTRIILAIDPGVASMGYAVVMARRRAFKVMDYGCTRTKAGEEFAGRLLKLFQACVLLARKHKATEFAVERIFFSRNVKTAMLVAQAQGVAVLAAAMAGIKVSLYTPMQVKMSVTGHGNADKKSVATMTQRILGLAELPRPDDAADALALAYCHAVSTRHGEKK